MNPALNTRATLLTDGSSDAALSPILEWLWAQHRPDELIEIQYAEMSATRLDTLELPVRLCAAIDLYPCDILFIHRDAEKERPLRRYEEILAAVDSLEVKARPASVCVVPVRMSEAWMLFDEKAIRTAADNPNGTMPLLLPGASKVEGLSDPKAVLHQLLIEASGLPPQRRGRFKSAKHAFLVTKHIRDFTPLRQLPAFRKLEEDFLAALADLP